MKYVIIDHTVTRPYRNILSPPDGTELPYKPKRHRLQLNVTEVGSERRSTQGGQYLQLHAPDIHPRHAVMAHTEGIVTVTPNNPKAETYVDNNRIFETTMLQHGMTVRFGHNFAFRFCDPVFEEVSTGIDTIQPFLNFQSMFLKICFCSWDIISKSWNFLLVDFNWNLGLVDWRIWKWKLY